MEIYLEIPLPEMPTEKPVEPDPEPRLLILDLSPENENAISI